MVKVNKKEFPILVELLIKISLIILYKTRFFMSTFWKVKKEYQEPIQFWIVPGTLSAIHLIEFVLYFHILFGILIKLLDNLTHIPAEFIDFINLFI